MIDEIRYKGMTTVPSDYSCPDGELAVSANIIYEDGSLKAIAQPSAIFNIAGNIRIKSLHETASIHNYIALDLNNNTLFWFDKKEIDDAEDKPVDKTDLGPNNENTIYKFGSEEIKEVTPIGNTLIVVANKGMHYVLWKEGKYHYLGKHLPELPISFGLKGYVKIDKSRDLPKEIPSASWTDEEKQNVKITIEASINKYVSDASKAGRFVYPFLVRYAFRMYDGSLTMHSSPVLMLTAEKNMPVVHLPSNNEISICGMVHSLDAQIIIDKGVYKEEFDLWQDIIKSVDIFISKPIQFFDFNEKKTDMSAFIMNDLYMKGEHNPYGIFRLMTGGRTYDYEFQTIHEKLFPTYAESEVLAVNVDDIMKDDKTIRDEIKNTSQFFYVKSLPIDELESFWNERTVVEIDNLTSLLTHEAMTDDFDSHDEILPGNTFVYNNRLNLANITKRPYDKIWASQFVSFTNGATDMLKYTMYVYINVEGKRIVLQSASSIMKSNQPFQYIYYPSPYAYKVVIKKEQIEGSEIEYIEYNLTKHPFLNGMYVAEADEGKSVSRVDAETPEAERIIEMPNKLYTSEINNPFRFPVTGINTIGIGRILGLSSATKALSQGQFGQFPLYVFATDGIYALSVSSTGTFETKHPVTRDICINKESITQIDTAVLFATDRGIMLLSGADSVCITDEINNIEDIDITIDYRLVRRQDISPSGSGFMLWKFKDFMIKASLIYDYANQRIILFNDEDTDFAYVYSMKSKCWGLMEDATIYKINSYPNSLAVRLDEDAEGNQYHQVVDFTQQSDDIPKQLIATRPIKGSVDILKTVDSVIQRGIFGKGNVAQALYGSRNLISWHLVWTSTDHILRGFSGTPYKYFRIVVMSSLSKDESLTGATINFTQKETNKSR